LLPVSRIVCQTNVSGLGFRGNCEEEKNREKISSLDVLLLLRQAKSKEEETLTNILIPRKDDILPKEKI